MRILLGFGLLAGCQSGEDYLSEGQDLSASGDFRSAKLIFEKAILENPFLKEAYIYLGHCHENLNQHDSALHIYGKLLDLYPHNTAAFYYSGNCKYNQEKFGEAIAFYDKAIDSKGGFYASDTTSIQALIDLNKDNFESESAEFDIPSREILYDRAMAYFKTGQMKNACCDFSSCIIQNYNTEMSHYMIGVCRNKKGKSSPVYSHTTFLH